MCLSQTAGRSSGEIEQNKAMDRPILCHPSKQHCCLLRTGSLGTQGSGPEPSPGSSQAQAHKLGKSPGFRAAHGMLGIQAEAQGKADTRARPGNWWGRAGGMWQGGHCPDKQEGLLPGMVKGKLCLPLMSQDG